MSTLTAEQTAAIAAYIAPRSLGVDIGTEDRPCSIAAVNLALTGELTDDIPGCMSMVIGRWVTCIQDFMPDDVRNGERWRALLPLAAGTGREHEAERAFILLNWMWDVVLPQLQTAADLLGVGTAWARMCRDRSEEPARAVVFWAKSLKAPEAVSLWVAASWVVEAVLSAKPESVWEEVAVAVASAAREGRNGAWLAAVRAGAMLGEELDEIEEASALTAIKKYWECIDPAGVLARMASVSGEKGERA